jgi:hypothetical protein
MATMRNIEETHATSCCCCETGKKLHFLHNYLFIILAKTFYCWNPDGIEGRPVAQTAAAFFLGI